jgi:hypothetical protein
VEEGSFSSWSIGLAAAVDAFKELRLYYIYKNRHFLSVALLSVSSLFFVTENVFHAT